MICIPIVANNMEDAIRGMAEASKTADIIELRTDYIKNPDLDLLLEKRTKPVIVTNRPVREGGLFEGSEESRLSFLQQAIRLKADYVDIEHDSIKKTDWANIRRSSMSGTKIITSYHNFQETPANMLTTFQELSRSGADIVKIVTFANTITDNIKIYQLLRQSKLPLISFCMGEYGLISRILYKKFGSYLTFASLRTGKESAPGQISIQELINTYLAHKRNRDTAIYGLIGNPVSHSISPVIHNTLFREMDLNNIYVPFKVDDVGAFIRGFKKLNIRGYSVTIPYKEEAMAYLDEIDPMAEKIGAINTIVNKDEYLIGYNTDCNAAVTTLEEVYGEDTKTSNGDNHFRNKRITIVGAGGVARAIAFGLKNRGAHITIVGRNYERMQSLAGDVECQCCPLKDLRAIETDILINATPVGMYPSEHESLIDQSILKSGMIVFDTIYNPPETKLLKDARAKGCKTVGGLPMFIHQASAQYMLWTNRKPPFDLIKDIAYRD